jgi:hypothetical protein
MMLTLALTVVVADTVDPDVGDVIVTTRLPSCADARGARNQAEPSIASSTATYADFADLHGDD